MSAPKDAAPGDPRIERERRTVAAMIGIYCRDRHGAAPALCAECADLLDYAGRRLDNCPFARAKPACKDCRVHCYSASARARIKEVLRYALPRLALRHPWLALMQLLDERRPTLALRDGKPKGKARASATPAKAGD